MPIVGAFAVPHPPLIVKEVGKGAEDEILETTKSYQKIAKEIANLKPETIIISSPHTTIYSDYFHISPGDSATGSFKSFGAPEVEFREEYDEELVRKIESICKRENFPAGTRGEKDKSLDHGTMVPLYFIRKEIPKCKIIRVGISDLSLLKHYELGEIIKEAVNNLNRRVVYVASGDLSHKLQTYGPYGFNQDGPVYDKKIVEVLKEADFKELFNFSEELLENASPCGHPSFTMMAGALDKIKVKSEFLSHQDVTGVGYGLWSFIPIEEDENRNIKEKYLEAEKERIKIKKDKNDYLRLAYKTIEEIVKNNKTIDVPNDISEELRNNKSAMFTSIHKFGKLRGCVGTFLPTRDSIAEELIYSAVNASTKDFRFPTITEDELPYLDVTVYKLHEPEKVEDRNTLDPKKYGVVVSSQYKRGLLLPDLPGIDTVEEQIQIARRKGNILPDEEIEIERFLVEKYD